MAVSTSCRHLLGLDGLPVDTMRALFDRAEHWLPIAKGDAPPVDLLRGSIVANVFLEDSTRTRLSFTIAAQRLGAATVDLTGSGSSVSKGESLLDTAMNVAAMGVNAMVVRCTPAGGPMQIADHVTMPVINAGDGAHEHPTQGLLDVFTMKQRFGTIDHLRVAIVGDIASSRVARSNMHALTSVGAHVILVGPPELVPDDLASITDGPGTVEIAHDLDSVLSQVDVIMMLRVQFERHEGKALSPDYRNRFGLTAARADQLPESAIVMHPGPMNRGLEIESDVAHDPVRSVILDQVTHGVAMRMAVLEWVMGDQRGA
ncbi:MAG: aspartate carbamoyltransferase catalytic subunit [Planctomycetota bacterium]